MTRHVTQAYGKELKADSGGDYCEGLVLGKDDNMGWAVDSDNDRMKESAWAEDGRPVSDNSVTSSHP